MDWIIWTISGIILIGFMIGVYRGAIRIAVSIVTAVLTIIVTVFVTPYVAGIVEDKTPLDESITEYVVGTMADAANALLPVEETGTGLTEERVKKVLKAAGVSKKDLKKAGITVDDIVNGGVKKDDLKALGVSAKILDGQRHLEEEAVDELMEKEDIPKDIQIKVIETADFPEVFKKLLAENNNDVVYSELGVETFAQYVGTYFAKILIHIATFLALFLLVSIVLRAFVFALNVVNEIPVFGLVNRLAGGVAGAAFSLLVVWFLFTVMTLFYTTDIGKQMYETVEGTAYTRYLLENNPLLKISMKF